MLRYHKYNGVNCRKTCTRYGSDFIGRYGFLADLTRPKIRTKAMAFVGLSIGIAFILALVFLHITYSFVGLNGLFFIVGLLGIFAVLVVLGIKETKVSYGQKL